MISVEDVRDVGVRSAQRLDRHRRALDGQAVDVDGDFIGAVSEIQRENQT